MAQKDIYLASEADAWFRRNGDASLVWPDVVADVLSRFPMQPTRILDVGCGMGAVLDKLRERTGATCVGIDPSKEAIAVGKQRYPQLALSVGTADQLDFDDASFDLVLFGACLSLVDPSDHFRIAYQTDRILKDKGWLAVWDFLPPFPHRRAYRHRPDVATRKLEFSTLWSHHPHYRMLGRQYLEFDPGKVEISPHSTMGIDILRKDVEAGFLPFEPA